jgi:hypothetical protein
MTKRKQKAAAEPVTVKLHAGLIGKGRILVVTPDGENYHHPGTPLRLSLKVGDEVTLRVEPLAAA